MNRIAEVMEELGLPTAAALNMLVDHDTVTVKYHIPALVKLVEKRVASEMVEPSVLATPHPLQTIFDQCVEQAASGKGEERHGHGAAFMEQPWAHLTEAFGVGGPLFQASKKIGESVQFLGTTEQFRFKAELLGAINYVAMALLAFEQAELQAKAGGCAGCGDCSCSGEPKSAQMQFDPVTGEEFKTGPNWADEYRAYHGPVAWFYNPWTGARRDPRDIGSDPHGHLIAPF